MWNPHFVFGAMDEGSIPDSHPVSEPPPILNSAPGPPPSCPVQDAKIGDKHTEMKEAWQLTCIINRHPKRDNKIHVWNHIKDSLKENF